jgi:hypothetical protein
LFKGKLLTAVVLTRALSLGSLQLELEVWNKVTHSWEFMYVWDRVLNYIVFIVRVWEWDVATFIVFTTQASTQALRSDVQHRLVSYQRPNKNTKYSSN